MFFIVFRLPNINISSHRNWNIESCKRYPALLILFGLQIVVLCSGEYIEILNWKFGKCIMKSLVSNYSWSQGFCWTQQKLIVDFCQGNVAAGAVPHRWFPLILTWQHNRENETSARWAGREVPWAERPQGWWRHPCAASSSWSTMKNPGEDGPARLNIWKFRGQNAALRRAQGRWLLLLQKPPEAFMHQCHFFLPQGGSFSLCLSWVSRWAGPKPWASWTEKMRCCSALPSHRAVRPQRRAQRPRDHSFGHIAIAEVHCWKQKLWPLFPF